MSINTPLINIYEVIIKVVHERKRDGEIMRVALEFKITEKRKLMDVR